MLLCWLSTILILSIVVWVVLRFLMKSKRTRTQNLMIILGKGGHTAEMLYMCQRYDFKRFKKLYVVVGEDDDLSKNKALLFWKEHQVPLDGKIEWVVIPRSRINQEGVLKSAFSALNSLITAALIIYKLPDIEAVVSCGAGIALSIFVPYFTLFVIFLSNSANPYESSPKINFH